MTVTALFWYCKYIVYIYIYIYEYMYIYIYTMYIMYIDQLHHIIYKYSHYSMRSIAIHKLGNPFFTNAMIPTWTQVEKWGVASREVPSWWTSWDVSLGLTRICSMLMRKAWWECFAMNMSGTRLEHCWIFTDRDIPNRSKQKIWHYITMYIIAARITLICETYRNVLKFVETIYVFCLSSTRWDDMCSGWDSVPKTGGLVEFSGC